MFQTSQFAVLTPSSSTSSQPQNSNRRSGAALVRKRERDRENQRRKRGREREYIASLEAKIRNLEGQLAETTAFCHTPSRAFQSSPTSAGCGSDADCSIQDDLEVCLPSPIVIGDPVVPNVGQSPDEQLLRCFPVCDGMIQPSTSAESLSTSLVVAKAFAEVEAEGVFVCPEVLTKLLKTPEWCRISAWDLSRPTSSYQFLNRGQAFAPLIAKLRAEKQMEVACPPEPKALDLLFGGSSNLLANFLHSELANLPLLPPEKFASSWGMYTYFRWLVWPTQENFLRLPESLRPTTLQLIQSHHLSFDVIPWPHLRDNFIRYGGRYDLEHVLGLLCCAFRITGIYGKEFITRQNDGEPMVKDDFKENFLTPEKWRLSERFWVDYPDLVQGLDYSIMLKEDPDGRL